MTGHAIDADVTEFRAFSRRIVNSLVRIKDRNLYMKYLTEYVGYKQAHLEYERIDRAGKPEPTGLLGSTSQAISILVANSNKPLRAVALVGLFASAVNLAYAIFALAVGVLRDSVDGISAAEGWASTNVFSAVMFFLLFAMLAVLSEYVQRILEESQQRPLYYIAYESNSSVVDQYRDSLNVV